MRSPCGEGLNCSGARQYTRACRKEGRRRGRGGQGPPPATEPGSAAEPRLRFDESRRAIEDRPAKPITADTMACGWALRYQMALQKRENFLAAFSSFLVADVVAEQLPPLGMPEAGVDALHLGIDDVEAFDRREPVLEAGEPEVRPRRDERVDLRCREFLQQPGDEVIHAKIGRASCRE